MKVHKFSCFALLSHGEYFFLEEKLPVVAGKPPVFKLFGGTAEKHNGEHNSSTLAKFIHAQTATSKYSRNAEMCLLREVWEETGIHLRSEKSSKSRNVFFPASGKYPENHLTHMQHHELTERQAQKILQVAPTEKSQVVRLHKDEVFREKGRVHPKFSEKHALLLHYWQAGNSHDLVTHVFKSVQNAPQAGNHALGFGDAALIPG